MCGGTYADVYPGSALTRLKHLASSNDPAVRHEVSTAVGRIAGSIGPYRLLGYLQDWLPNADSARAETLIDSIRGTLAQPEIRMALSTDARRAWPSSDGGPAQRFWTQALKTLPYSLVTPLVQAWLSAAAEVPVPSRRPLVDLLVDAAGNDYQRVGRLDYAIRPAPPTPDEDDVLGHLIVRVSTRLDELAALPIRAAEENLA